MVSNKPRKISDTGLKLLKDFEGLLLTSYKDIAGVWTNGYGSTAGVREGQTLTEKEAEDLLRRDLEFFEAAVRRYVTVPMEQRHFDAFTCLCYNIGVGAFKKSTALRKFNEGDIFASGNAILLFHKYRAPNTGKLVPSKGLLRRRKAEKRLFEGYGYP